MACDALVSYEADGPVKEEEASLLMFPSVQDHACMYSGEGRAKVGTETND